MKKEAIFKIMLISLSIFISGSVYSQTNMIVKMRDGTEKGMLISTVDKLSFANNNLVLKLSSGNSDVFTLSAVHKIIFGTLSAVAGISTNANQVEIYLNPATNIINLKNLSEIDSKISIYTITGSLAVETTLNTTSNQIDVSQLPKGFYVLKVNNNALKFTKK